MLVCINRLQAPLRMLHEVLMHNKFSATILCAAQSTPLPAITGTAVPQTPTTYDDALELPRAVSYHPFLHRRGMQQSQHLERVRRLATPKPFDKGDCAATGNE